MRWAPMVTPLRQVLPFLVASRLSPGLAAMFWLFAFQGSITTTVLRTNAVQGARGFADTDMGED